MLRLRCCAQVVPGPYERFFLIQRIIGFNPIRPGSHQINARQFKMTIILEQFKVLVSYFMTFSSEALCMISQKNRPGPCLVCVAALMQFQSPTRNSKSKILILWL